MTAKRDYYVACHADGRHIQQADGGPDDDFGTLVWKTRERAERHAQGEGDCFGYSGHAEIDELYRAFAVKHQVLGTPIPVDYAFFVKVCKPVRRRQHDVHPPPHHVRRPWSTP